MPTLGSQQHKKEVQNAVKQARATQMYAEMLAMVCHPEYYRQGDQMVHLPYTES